MSTTRAITTPAVLALVAGFALGGCSKSDKPVSDSKSPAEVIALAKKNLDETSGLNLSLSTKDLPDGVSGIAGAQGVATAAPAFEGKITVVLSGNSFDVPVVAVDSKVYAQIPLVPGWSVVDPGDYGAPDPAQLVTPDHGFSAMLTATTDLEAGESVRGGADNNEILTEYTGTVPGDAMTAIIPSAQGDDFDASYLISDDGELREAELTGSFYKDSPEMTYTVDFEDYGTTKEIAAP
jgi:lipoprotein LprG